MPQFLISQGKRLGDLVTLPPAEARHLKEVLRVSPGEKVRLFDGTGNRFWAEVTSVSKREVIVRIAGKMPSEKTAFSLNIGQALLKRDKMEMVIQKAAELGVSFLSPFFSSRTIVKSQKQEKIERWQKIADEAAKQCGRGERMSIHPPLPFDRLLEEAQGDLKLIFWEEGGEPIRNFFRKQEIAISSILALIGPEGGFSNEEIKSAERSGFVCLSLGSRILRAETAGIAVSTLIQYELGNF